MQPEGPSNVPVVPEQRTSSLYAQRDTGSSASQTARPTGYARAGQQTGSASVIRPLETDRSFMNVLMGGGMSGLQARRTGRRIGGEDGNLRDQRDFYKKKVEGLEKEKKEREDKGKNVRRTLTPGPSGGSSGPQRPFGPGPPSPPGSPDPSEPDEPPPDPPVDPQEAEMLRRAQLLLGTGSKGPKMKVPETFTGQRDDVTRFVRQCRVYLAAKPQEFQSEMEKQLWITSLCHGKAVEGWCQDTSDTQIRRS